LTERDVLPRRFGAYLLLKKLAEGGNGSVFLATRDRELLVIKRLPPLAGNAKEMILRLEHEAKIAVHVEDPHVVRVLDVGVVLGRDHFLTMEYVRGWPLSRLLQTAFAAGRRLGIAETTALILGALRGLSAIHTAKHPETDEPLAAVHRDVSPRNVMLTPDARAVIIDLGLGKSNLQEWVTRAGRISGTPGYVSPEQVLGDRVDQRSDLYSIAVLLFELITLEHYVPRSDPMSTMRRALNANFRPPSTIRPDAPKALDAVLERALALRPEDRYASARELEDALQAAVPEVRAARGRFDFGEELEAELERADRELELLLALDEASLPSADAEPTRIFASRRDHEVSTVRDRSSIEGAEPITERPERGVTVKGFDATTRTVRPAALARARATKRHGLYGWIALLAVALAVLLWLALDVEPTETARVDPHPIEPAAVTPHVADPNEAPPATDSLPAPARHGLARAGPRAAPSLPAPEKHPSEPPKTTDLPSLMRRAMRLRDALPAERERIDELVTDVALWTQSPNEARARQAYEAFERRLAEIEARAP
jgi:serine/threonine protein kinase